MLIAENNEILYSYYSSNRGNPVSTRARAAARPSTAPCGDRITIAGCAVTGYGEELIKHAFHADDGAGRDDGALHGGAAISVPNVDFILDIGGQDIKCFKIQNGAIDSHHAQRGLLIRLRLVHRDLCHAPWATDVENFAASWA